MQNNKIPQVAEVNCFPVTPGKKKNTPRKFNSSPLKNGGCKTILSFWVSAYFQGRAVKLREGNASWNEAGTHKYILESP